MRVTLVFDGGETVQLFWEPAPGWRVPGATPIVIEPVGPDYPEGGLDQLLEAHPHLGETKRVVVVPDSLGPEKLGALFHDLNDHGYTWVVTWLPAEPS
ncbi:MAG: hypothetical protein KDC39_15100 [Actinobacteria bacterium]|nr:hypothetical protein [Actinomycetota bacterium]